MHQRVGTRPPIGIAAGFRNRDGERGPLPRRALDRDLPAMRLCEFSDRRKAKAEAGDRRFTPNIWLEAFRPHLRSDARPRGGPVSITAISTALATCRTRMVTRRCGASPMNFMALETKLVVILISTPGLHAAIGAGSGAS